MGFKYIYTLTRQPKRLRTVVVEGCVYKKIVPVELIIRDDEANMLNERYILQQKQILNIYCNNKNRTIHKLKHF